MVDHVINSVFLSHHHQHQRQQQPFQINTFMVSQQQAVTAH
jgi:hypothetical protein